MNGNYLSINIFLHPKDWVGIRFYEYGFQILFLEIEFVRV